MAAADGLRGANMSDYISREALTEAFENADADVCESFPDGYCDWGFGRQNIRDVIASVPTADVEPVRNGQWEECDWVDVDEHGFGTRRTFKAGLRCSQCACVFKKELLWKRNRCPSCGAKMEGGADG